MGRFKTAATGLAMAASGGALAADATFENHLSSTPMVSPAQIYQIDEATTDVALGYLSSEDSRKPEGVSKLSDTTTGTGLFAAGVYNVRAIGLRAGLSINYQSYAVEGDSYDATTSTTSSYEFDGTQMTFTPQVAMPVGPVVLGAALDVVQREAEFDGDSADSQHMTFRPGALFQNDDLEAGLTYRSPTRKTAEATDELAVKEAAAVTAHGRYAVNRDLAAGAILSNVNHKAVDEDAFKDQTQFKGTGEFRLGATKVEGELGYNTAYYKNKDVIAVESIGTTVFGAAADYSVNKGTTVGGGLNYEFGSDKSDNVSVENNTLTLAVRGNMAF